MRTPAPPLDLFVLANRLASELEQPPGSEEDEDRWYGTLEIHLLAARSLLERHKVDCLDPNSAREVLWDAPRVAPLLARLQRDCTQLAELTEAALGEVSSPTRNRGAVVHAVGELVRRINLHRVHEHEVYHEAFGVDIGGPG